MLHGTLLVKWLRSLKKQQTVFVLYIFSLLLSGSSLLAQTNETEINPMSFTIGFGETLTLPFQDSEHFSWYIKEIEMSEVLHQGAGIALNDFIFELPGKYIVVLQETTSQTDEKSHGCNHSNVPSEIVVTVRPYRLEFFFEEISYSRELHGGIDMGGTIMNVPVKIESYMNQEIEIGGFYMKSAGVSTTLEGKMKNQSNSLLPGLYSLTYELDGTAEKNTYIMFDFFNNQEMLGTYYVPQLLN